ncbi:penicillin acylase family protein [Variovorax sp. PAMC26660]|uniref:penicillin acylase family protein n=1 Tax=Variovorax sp. PAMC26660 TaxID=2762322 RepID=UPI00164E34E8|nr:penicillin acylase family protein [Variovorax sp. PAMC26660]QNK65903.1 penicillin acylase family protein [Variovorax sp. PAMC26660]
MRRTHWRRASPLCLLTLIALTACGGGGGGGPGFLPVFGGNPVSPPAQDSYKAEIRRTAFGVPHIKADNFEGVGYGYGYAQAQDSLCTLADSFLTYRGERSRYFGADAQSVYAGILGRPLNLESDFFHKHVITADTLDAMRAAQPDTLRKLVEGFAAGYNRYVREIKAGGPENAACGKEAWVAPITPDDIYRRMYHAGLAGGYSNFVSGIAAAVPPSPQVARIASGSASALKAASSTVRRAVLPPIQVGGQKGIGSNMIGFGTTATGDASPLLFGNPHWYWHGPDRLYQAHLTVPGQLNVSGASFPGVPVMLLGFNDNVAWSHTVSTAKRYSLYQLQLAKDDATSYVRDGQNVKMQPTAITVTVKQPSGSLMQVTRTLYRSAYGPLVDLSGIDPSFAWSQSIAFAVRDINSQNYRVWRSWLRWNQAKSLDELVAVQREEAAVPWVNTVAVGRGSAKAWYADMGAVPNVSDAQIAQCNTDEGRALAALFGGGADAPIVLDGSRSACDWKDDPDSAQSGAIGPSRLPSLWRDDYVANMNDSYWLANPKAPLTGYPSIMGPAGTAPVSFRTQLGNRLAQDRLEGTDGYAGDKATVDTVKQMVLNSRAYNAEIFKTQMLDIVCAVPTISVIGDPLGDGIFPSPRDVDTAQACDVLRQWGNTGNIGARGAHIWDEFWSRASQLDAGALYAVPFSASDPLHTPRGVKSSAAVDLQQAFGAAVLRVKASPYPLDAARGDYLFTVRGGVKIPLYGGCVDGYFTHICANNRLDKGGYNMDSDAIANGNSYLQIVRFPQGGVEAHTLVSYSVSEDPASVHFGDYTQAYGNKQWLRLPFSEGEITGDAAYRSVTVRE